MEGKDRVRNVDTKRKIKYKIGRKKVMKLLNEKKYIYKRTKGRRKNCCY